MVYKRGWICTCLTVSLWKPLNHGREKILQDSAPPPHLCKLPMNKSISTSSFQPSIAFGTGVTFSSETKRGFKSGRWEMSLHYRFHAMRGGSLAADQGEGLGTRCPAGGFAHGGQNPEAPRRPVKDPGWLRDTWGSGGGNTNKGTTWTAQQAGHKLTEAEFLSGRPCLSDRR